MIALMHGLTLRQPEPGRFTSSADFDETLTAKLFSGRVEFWSWKTRTKDEARDVAKLKVPSGSDIHRVGGHDHSVQ